VEMSQVTRLGHSWLTIWGRLCKVYATFSCNIAQATPQSVQYKMIALYIHTDAHTSTHKHNAFVAAKKG